MRYRPGADSHRWEEPPGGTGALTRVLIESRDGSATWRTVGVERKCDRRALAGSGEAVKYGLLRAG